MAAPFHSLCIAGTHSGVGKTTVTLGLLAALVRRGMTIQPFKCGPDYIDAGHHRCACGTTSRNLDTWMMGKNGVLDSYSRASFNADAAVVEGVMGLFDGAAPDQLDGSTAHVCKLAGIPIVLVVDARAMARSIAPFVKGFAEFEPGVDIVGIVANGVSSERHQGILNDALLGAKLPQLIGALPRRETWSIPERHLGLAAHTEHAPDESWLADLADGIESYLDIDALLQICKRRRPARDKANQPKRVAGEPVRIGIARDDAFHFYYEDNLDLLRQAGAQLVEFSPLRDTCLPDGLDGLYIGGGFPEMFGEILAANITMRKSIRDYSDAGGHVYAECGGLMYLCKSLTDQQGRAWEMCGVLSARTRMEKRLRRLGYVEAVLLHDSLFGKKGDQVRGHEFHWSDLVMGKSDAEPLFMARFTRDKKETPTGICQRNVHASYIHIHFASNPSVARQWIENLRGHSKALRTPS